MPESESDALCLPAVERRALWNQVAAALEHHLATLSSRAVAPVVSEPESLRRQLASFDFAQPLAPDAAVRFAVAGMSDGQVHTPHPRYFGLFNPAPTTMGIAADALVAGFNPQIAAWSHSPFAAEVERHLVRAFAARFGLPPESDGVFASGGAEANHTALLCALVHRFPEYVRGGARALSASPALYVTSQTHHSVSKAARLCGLGDTAVAVIPVDGGMRLDPAALEAQIARDRAAGRLPFFVVATAGTTAAGVIDPLPGVAAVARAAGLWFHCDAAWGGAAALVPELRPFLQGIDQADSITFDAHKFLSVPMGAGMFLTRHPGVLAETFGIAAAYMPTVSAELNPYARSMQWSRRFIGLKVFLSLAVAGWDGYAAALGHQVAMGRLLREKLSAAGWELVNATPLPLVCFRPSDAANGAEIEAIAAAVVSSGEAWISTVQLPGGAALRACVTHYATVESDLDRLVAALAQVEGGGAYQRARRFT